VTVVKIDIDLLQGVVDKMSAVLSAGPGVTAALGAALGRVWQYSDRLAGVSPSSFFWANVEAQCNRLQRHILLARLANLPDCVFQTGSVVSFEDGIEARLPAGSTGDSPSLKEFNKLRDRLKWLLFDSGSNLSLAEIERVAALIANMVFTSPEPYRSIFINRVDDIQIQDIGDPGHPGQPNVGPCTNFLTNTIRIDVDQILTDQPAPAWTFFHEFAHSVDGRSGTPGYDSPDFPFPDSTGKDRSIYWWMQQDVQNNLQNALSNPANNLTQDPAQQKRIIDAVMMHTTFYLDGWLDRNWTQARAGSDAEALQALQDYFTNILSKPGMETSSDNFGSVTINSIAGRWKHTNYYWMFHPPAAAPEAEFFANYFADSMTNGYQLGTLANTNNAPSGWSAPPKGGRTSLEVTQASFPGASRATQAFAESLI